MSKTTIAKSILPAFVTVTMFLAVRVSALPSPPPNDDPGSAEPIVGSFVAGATAGTTGLKPIYFDASLTGRETHTIGVAHDSITHDNFPFTLIVDTLSTLMPDDRAAAEMLDATMPTAVLNDIDGVPADFAFVEGTGRYGVSGSTTVLADDSISVTTLPSPADDLDRGVPTGREWTIVATYPIPEGASGLAYDGTYLYCGIYGANGDEVYRIDPVTGSYVLLFTGPQGDAFGLTYDGTYLWTTDHPSNPAVAMQLDWDGDLLSQFDLPAQYMSGIAYDNGDFWVARYYDDPGHLYKVDSHGGILDEFDAPDNQPWDLCIENDNLWMADYYGDTLYQINPETGALLDSHPSEGANPAGIVWDGDYLWYCDNGVDYVYDYLYKVDLAGAGAPVINIPVSSHDFGTISIGDSETWDMTVGNVGVADLNITALTFSPPDDLSCPITFPVIIPPDGSEQLPVVYAPDDFGPLDATATVFSNDPIHPEEEVTLTGHGVYPDPYINISEDAHDYGSVRVSATTRWFMEIRNHGNEMLTIDDIVIDDSHFYLDDAVSLPIHISTLSSIDIGVWFSPDSATSYAATVAIHSNDPYHDPANVSLSGAGVQAQYPMGQELWSYLIDTDYDNSPKAIAPIPDVRGDGIADVIVCSEDDFIRCFNGNADGTGDVLWEHEIYGGSVYSQKALQIIKDIDGDGYHDVVVGAAWGARLIRALSGRTGQTIWTHDTHEHGGGGWVYQVDCSYDYNGDEVVDVLAATGDDASDTGPKRAYCLDGVTGLSIWETPLGGPVFAVIGVEDFTGDGQPDAVAGASDEYETQGWAYGIDGDDGSIEWSFPVGGSSVWALGQIDDITADGVGDVIVGDFGGSIYGLDATDGNEVYSGSGYSLITSFERLDDVNGDGHPDIVPAHLGSTARVIDGQTGNPVWSKLLADKPAAVARIADVSGDGINDVLIGTLFTNNYAYFLDGVDGTVIEAVAYGTPVDAIAAIPDIVGDGSWEMVAGGRNGLVTCFSGEIGDRPPVPSPEDSLGIPCTDDAQCGGEAKCIQNRCYVPKHRYISVARNAEQFPNTARRIKLQDGPVLGWVDAPDEAGALTLAEVVDTPVYADSDFTGDWPDVLHVIGCEIATGQTYEVQAIPLGAPINSEYSYSEVLPLHTPSTWGDTVSGSGPSMSPPDGVAGITDIMATIAYFQGDYVAPLTWLDIDSSVGAGVPDQTVAIGDIMSCIAGFQSEAYPGLGPLDCP